MSARIWLPGARGQLGHACQRVLANTGHTLLPTGHELAIEDIDAVRAFVTRERPTHVINCAAWTAVDKAESEPDQARRVNVIGAANVARFIHGPALHVSTDYVFSGEETAPIAETAPTGPASVYGRTKLEGEQAFREAGEGPRFVVRTSWVFGREGHNFVATVLRLMAERTELRVVDDQRGRPTYADHLAEACVDLLGLRGRPPAASGTWHFASAGACSWYEFAVTILRAAKERGIPLKCERVVPIKTHEYPTPARRPAWSVLDTKAIENALGRACPPWSAGLEAVLADRMTKP